MEQNKRFTYCITSKRVTSNMLSPQHSAKAAQYSRLKHFAFLNPRQNGWDYRHKHNT